MMSVKTAEDPEKALQALWPRLQVLAIELVRDERISYNAAPFRVAFEAQWAGDLSYCG